MTAVNEERGMSLAPLSLSIPSSRGSLMPMIHALRHHEATSRRTAFGDAAGSGILAPAVP